MHPHSNVSNVAVILKLNIRILFELRKYSAGKTGQNILIWVTTRWKKTINYKVKSPIFYFCRIMSLSGSTSDCICIFNPLLAAKTLKLTLRNAATTFLGLGFYFYSLLAWYEEIAWYCSTLTLVSLRSPDRMSPSYWRGEIACWTHCWDIKENRGGSGK